MYSLTQPIYLLTNPPYHHRHHRCCLCLCLLVDRNQTKSEHISAERVRHHLPLPPCAQIHPLIPFFTHTLFCYNPLSLTHSPSTSLTLSVSVSIHLLLHTNTYPFFSTHPLMTTQWLLANGACMWIVKWGRNRPLDINLYGMGDAQSNVVRARPVKYCVIWLDQSNIWLKKQAITFSKGLLSIATVVMMQDWWWENVVVRYLIRKYSIFGSWDQTQIQYNESK